MIVLVKGQSGLLWLLWCFGCLFSTVLLDLGQDPVLVELILKIANASGSSSLLALFGGSGATLPIVVLVVVDVSGFLLTITLEGSVVLLDIFIWEVNIDVFDNLCLGVLLNRLPEWLVYD